MRIPLRGSARRPSRRALMNVGDGSVLRVRWRLPPSPHAGAASANASRSLRPGMVAPVGALTAVDLPPKPPTRPERKPGEAGLRAGAPAGGDGQSPPPPAQIIPAPTNTKRTRALPASAPAKRDPPSPESAQHFQGMRGAQSAPRTPATSRSPAAAAA